MPRPPQRSRLRGALAALPVSFLLVSTPRPALAQAPAIITVAVPASDYARAREALQDAIENQGLVLGPVSHFGEMLERTGPSLGRNGRVYKQAEVFHFCSATIAWRLVEENPANIALCPLSVTLYTLPDTADSVYFSYRTPGDASLGRQQASELLRRIVAEATANARR